MATLQEIRTAARLTQVQLAEQAGISESTVQKLERAEVLPSYATLTRLRQVLGDEILDVVFRADNRRFRGKGRKSTEADRYQPSDDHAEARKGDDSDGND